MITIPIQYKKFRCREYSPGKWQIYFSHEKKQVHLQKGLSNQPLRSESDALAVIGWLETVGYKPREWGKDMTFHFDVAAENWLKLNTACPEWIEKRRSMAERHWIPYFGKQDIREIKTIHITQFQVNLIDRGFPKKRIKGLLAELKTLFRFYRKSLPDIPDFPKIQVQPSPIRWLDEEQQEKVFQFIPQEDLPIFQFMRHYGCRVNEASGLLRENLFLQHNPKYLIISTVLDYRGNLKPSTKTDRIKVLPILPELEWLFKGEGKFVFEKKGRNYTNRMLRRVWNIANRKSGVVKINLYNAMRHSFGCQRLNQGYPLEQVQQVMGHTTTMMTKRYAQYATENLVGIIRGKVINENSLFIDLKTENFKEINKEMVGARGFEPPCPFQHSCLKFKELQSAKNPIYRSFIKPHRLLRILSEKEK